jgi:ParB-like chromosome segregation protein Spo0J
MSTTAALAIHEVCRLFPEHDPESRARLKARIEQFGVRDAIVTWQDGDGRHWIVDGRTWWEIGSELGIDVPAEEFKGGESEMLDFVLDKNFARRHLTPSQQVALRLKADTLAEAYRNPGGASGRPRSNLDGSANSPRGRASEELAGKAGTSRRLVEYGRAIQRHSPELLDQVAAGEKSITEAVKELPHPQRENGAGSAPFSSGSECPADEAIVRDQLGHPAPPHLLKPFGVSSVVHDAKPISRQHH